MKTNIIQIGNSRGIRLPKKIIEQCDFKDEIELIVHNNEIILKSSTKPRDGWKTSFKKMAENRDDILLDTEVIQTTEWDNNNWEWK